MKKAVRESVLFLFCLCSVLFLIFCPLAHGEEAYVSPHLRLLPEGSGREAILTEAERVGGIPLFGLGGVLIPRSSDPSAPLGRELVLPPSSSSADVEFGAEEDVPIASGHKPWHMKYFLSLTADAATRTFQDTMIVLFDTGLNDEVPMHVDWENAFTFRNNEIVTANGDRSLLKDVIGHGTKVASIIAHADGGVLPNIRILPVKILWDASEPSPGNDRLGTYEVYILAMDHLAKAVSQGLLPRKLVLSSSIYCLYEEKYQWKDLMYMQDVYEAATRGGFIFIQAAGNDARDLDEKRDVPRPNRQAIHLRVAASRGGGALSPETNYGRDVVDMALPGWKTHIPGTPGNMYHSGTSFAAPLAAAAVAYAWDKNPDWLRWQIRNAVLQAAPADAPPLETLSGRVGYPNLLAEPNFFARVNRYDPFYRPMYEKDFPFSTKTAAIDLGSLSDEENDEGFLEGLGAGCSVTQDDAWRGRGRGLSSILLCLLAMVLPFFIAFVVL